MARVQLVMANDDRDSFVHQARREGMSLSAWLREAARERLEKRRSVRLFQSPEDVEEFFRSCAALDGPETEPDWSEHLRVISESRREEPPGPEGNEDLWPGVRGRGWQADDHVWEGNEHVERQHKGHIHQKP